MYHSNFKESKNPNVTAQEAISFFNISKTFHFDQSPTIINNCADFNHCLPAGVRRTIHTRSRNRYFNVTINYLAKCGVCLAQRDAFKIISYCWKNTRTACVKVLTKPVWHNESICKWYWSAWKLTHIILKSMAIEEN